MRLKVKINPIKAIDSNFIKNYNNIINSFLYSILKKGYKNVKNIHNIKDKTSLKFCFSNIKGVERNNNWKITPKDWKSFHNYKKKNKVKPYYFYISTNNQMVYLTFLKYFKDLFFESERKHPKVFSYPIIDIGGYNFAVLGISSDNFESNFNTYKIENLCLTDNNQNILIPDSMSAIIKNNKLDIPIKKISDKDYKERLIENIINKYKIISSNNKEEFDNFKTPDLVFSKIDYKGYAFLKIKVKRNTNNSSILYFPVIKKVYFSIETKDKSEDLFKEILSKTADYGYGKNNSYGFGFVFANKAPLEINQQKRKEGDSSD
jgi:predicted house-cleaning noncanonical NTP pyrophosphatase (MazG superfamily)